MDLQRADARRQVENAIQASCLEPAHQARARASAVQIEHRLAVFDEQVRIPGAPIDHARPAALSRQGLEDRTRRLDVASARRCRPTRGTQVRKPRLLGPSERLGLCGRQALEAHPIAGPELPQFPELRARERCRTHESAQGGPIRAQDDRHVAGEIDGADGVGVVVDVRGMQTRLAAIAPRPLRLRSDQPHAGAARVVVNLPSRSRRRCRCRCR